MREQLKFYELQRIDPLPPGIQRISQIFRDGRKIGKCIAHNYEQRNFVWACGQYVSTFDYFLLKSEKKIIMDFKSVME